jgi:hypothetical protein
VTHAAQSADERAVALPYARHHATECVSPDARLLDLGFGEGDASRVTFEHVRHQVDDLGPALDLLAEVLP